MRSLQPHTTDGRPERDHLDRLVQGAVYAIAVVAAAAFVYVFFIH